MKSFLSDLIRGSVLILFTLNFAIAQDDPREYQHGIDFLKRSAGQYWLIWSSTGNPPNGADDDGSWPHDVYYSEINPANPVINPQTIIDSPEAQEPSSSAVTSDGNIMITFEDGWDADQEINVLAQRYGIYDANLNDIKPYPNMVFDGGHSGHVAAVGNHFVVFFSEGWIKGGGVNNLGSGNDVLLSVYSSAGNYQRSKNISVGDTHRDWWPMVAGSSHRALLVWQRFIDGKNYVDMMYAVYNPTSGEIVSGPTELESWVDFYDYDVQYLADVDRFLVIGKYWDGGGFAYLVDNAGNVTANNAALPEIPKEAQLMARQTSAGLKVAYPRNPSGLVVLNVTASSIGIAEEIDDTYQWQQPLGIDGIFTGDFKVYVVALSTSGLVEKYFYLNGYEEDATVYEDAEEGNTSG